jgi:FlaA1/EpsC-like NDP-sugar epimerase
VREQATAGRPASGPSLVPPPRNSAPLLFVYDVAVVLLASLAALLIRFDSTDFGAAVAPFLPTALIPVLVRPVSFLAFGLYRREWLYASMRELRDLVIAVVAGSVAIVVIYVGLDALGAPGTEPFPRSFFGLEALMSLVGVAAGRFLVRLSLERRTSAVRAIGRVMELPTLVYGAGEAGAFVGRLAARGALAGVRLVGYLDDDRRKQGSRLLGHRVLGDLTQLDHAVNRTGATQLLIAIPSGPGNPVRRAVTAAQELGLVVKTVPPLRDLMTGRSRISGIRSVSVEDLLRRQPVAIDTDAISAAINGASVLVTGGGGSIGGELVRQILTLGPRVLTILDHHEWTLWNVERDIAARRMESEGAHTVAALADVRSRSALDAVMRRAKPDIVFHAAALKHVPYVELFPSEGVLTNVIGTRNVLHSCEQAGVKRFVLISTDKAVEPVSVMGATKRLAEQLTVAAAHRSGRAYAAVRFGNVLGSSGSVVPLLQRQLDDGLPLTITQPGATRYFMTIAEAVSLILEAAVDPSPGDIYVLDMGEPIRIIDLARDLVRLNGLDPDSASFTVTGLRPGERLHEKLFYDDELAESTKHQGILRASRALTPAREAEIEDLVDHLETAAREQDDQTIRELLLRGRYLGSDARDDEAQVSRDASSRSIS